MIKQISPVTMLLLFQSIESKDRQYTFEYDEVVDDSRHERSGCCTGERRGQ